MYTQQEEDRYSVRCAGCHLLYKYTSTKDEATYLATSLECPYCAWDDFPF